MEHSADYFVKGRQLERLEEALEKVEAFHKLITCPEDGRFDIPTIDDEDERRMQGGHDQFTQALRELKYLAEDIGGQEIQVCGG